MKTVRCAIYTRKSSDEGLEQDFNSLDAQREACAAYILSQTSEGWTALPERYDDGGISGGTLERPALQRLLADVAAGKIDIIVVYKVDRLTRSLLDFSKLVETFDKADASFVSITQSFNTTSSMGRLTLNMLLSFAQFEREVTAERIRDKIAASKAKGMWMGGIPPLGYKPDGRSLAVVEEHAEIVRLIFKRYLELGSVRLLVEDLDSRGVGSPKRKLTSGREIGGCAFSRGQLYLILKCQTYLGEVAHQGKTHQGLHQALLDREVWDRAQAMLASHTRGRRRGRRNSASALLTGKVVDGAGEPLVAVHATKGKVRYHYYVSRALQHGDAKQGFRIPARELDKLVAHRLADALDDPLGLVVTADLQPRADQFATLDERGRAQAVLLRERAREPAAKDLWDRLISKVHIEQSGITIEGDRAELGRLLGVEAAGETRTFTLTSAARLARTGRAMRLVQGESPVASIGEGSLIRLMGQAQLYWRELRQGQLDITRLTEREKISAAYITRVLRLAFLSPQVVESILAGRHKSGVNGQMLLLRGGAVAPSWADQGTELIASHG